MPFQPINFANIAPQGNPFFRDLGQTVAEGMKLGRMPQQMRQQEEAARIANQLNQSKADFEPKRQQLYEALTQAQTEKALRPPTPSLSNLEKAIDGAQRIKMQFGENSPQAKYADAYVERLSQGSGTQLSVDPETGAVTFSQGSGGRGGQATQIVNGQLVQKPTSSTSTSQQKSSVANVVMQAMDPYMEHPYTDTGSNEQILADRFMYDKATPENKKIIGNDLVNAAVAWKLAPDYALNQLTVQGAQTTVPAIEKQTKVVKRGWPATLGKVVNNLPKELRPEVEKRYKQALAKINRDRGQFVASGLPIDLNKEEPIKDGGSVGMKREGKLYFIPQDKVKDALSKGFVYE